MIDYLGWTATITFVASYFCTRQDRLRALQMVGAILWMTYGIAIGASPVIVANVLVFSAAAWTTVRARQKRAPRRRPLRHGAHPILQTRFGSDDSPTSDSLGPSV
jgi:hypothetical protein